MASGTAEDIGNREGSIFFCGFFHSRIGAAQIDAGRVLCREKSSERG